MVPVAPEIGTGFSPYIQDKNKSGLQPLGHALHIANLEPDTDMREAAKKFEFEKAAKLRDQVKELRTKEFLFS